MPGKGCVRTYITPELGRRDCERSELRSNDDAARVAKYSEMNPVVGPSKLIERTVEANRSKTYLGHNEILLSPFTQGRRQGTTISAAFIHSDKNGKAFDDSRARQATLDFATKFGLPVYDFRSAKPREAYEYYRGHVALKESVLQL